MTELYPVAELTRVDGPDSDPSSPPTLLIEIPHGATDLSDYRHLAAQIQSPLPPDLHHFFLVNTDIGAPEIGARVARIWAEAAHKSALIVRCRIPRTFIDTNRTLDLSPGAYKDGGVTPGIPAYITHPADLELLRGLYARYREVVDSAWQEVMGAGGIGFTPHTYAPRSVGIDAVDHQIVEALHRVWSPDQVEQWPLRPEVDLITADPEGRELAPLSAVNALTTSLTADGVMVAQNGTYNLHPVTLGALRAAEWPGRVLCLEIRRDLLVETFTPFAPMPILPERVERFARPFAASLLGLLA